MLHMQKFFIIYSYQKSFIFNFGGFKMSLLNTVKYENFIVGRSTTMGNYFLDSVRTHLRIAKISKYAAQLENKYPY